MASLLRAIIGDVSELIRVYRGGSLERGGSMVAVVLGAQVLPGGRASRTLEARVSHAARLYSECAVELLIVTGGTGDHPPSEAEIMAGILRREGVPERDVVLEDQALSTWDSAWLVAKIAGQRGIESARLVTDPLHCVRSVEAFREAGLIAWAEPVYSSPMWRNSWLRRGQLARETGAVMWYRIRHRVGSRSRR